MDLDGSSAVQSLCAALNHQASQLKAGPTFRQLKLQAIKELKKAGNKGIIPSGPRKQGEGCEDEEQGILLAEQTENGGAKLAITLLAAGFVIGLAGATVREISRTSCTDIRSWNDHLVIGGHPRKVRTLVIEGKKKDVVRALHYITAGVDRYKELCEGRFSGKMVDREQIVNGITFIYSPPPRHAVPFAAGLKPDAVIFSSPSASSKGIPSPASLPHHSQKHHPRPRPRPRPRPHHDQDADHESDDEMEHLGEGSSPSPASNRPNTAGTDTTTDEAITPPAFTPSNQLHVPGSSPPSYLAAVDAARALLTPAPATNNPYRPERASHNNNEGTGAHTSQLLDVLRSLSPNLTRGTTTTTFMQQQQQQHNYHHQQQQPPVVVPRQPSPPVSTPVPTINTNNNVTASLFGTQTPPHVFDPNTLQAWAASFFDPPQQQQQQHQAGATHQTTTHTFNTHQSSLAPPASYSLDALMDLVHGPNPISDVLNGSMALEETLMMGGGGSRPNTVGGPVSGVGGLMDESTMQACGFPTFTQFAEHSPLFRHPTFSWGSSPMDFDSSMTSNL